jgi:hypothetical protein
MMLKPILPHSQWRRVLISAALLALLIALFVLFFDLIEAPQ